MDIVGIDIAFPLNEFSGDRVDEQVDCRSASIVDICTVFPPYVFLCGVLSLLVERKHMGIVGICMVFHLNAFSSEVLMRLHFWQKRDILRI